MIFPWFRICLSQLAERDQEVEIGVLAPGSSMPIIARIPKVSCGIAALWKGGKLAFKEQWRNLIMIATQYPFWKTGCVHPISQSWIDQEQSLVLDRLAIGQLSPELASLMLGKLAITASPDWRTICIFSQERWNKLFPKILRLPNSNPDARRIQRWLIESAHWFDEEEPIKIPGSLATYSGLHERKSQPLIVVFDKDNAEIWSDRHLTDFDAALPLQ